MTSVKFICCRRQASPVVLPALAIALAACACVGPGYGQDRSGGGPLALYDFRDVSVSMRGTNLTNVDFQQHYVGDVIGRRIVVEAGVNFDWSQ